MPCSQASTKHYFDVIMSAVASPTTSVLLNRLFRRISMKAAKRRVTGLCEATPPVTGGFPAQRASDAENVSIWWHHHDLKYTGARPLNGWHWLDLKYPDSKVHGAHMGPNLGRQDPGGPHVGAMNLAILEGTPIIVTVTNTRVTYPVI